MDIKWNYNQRVCDISVLGSVIKKLEKSKHKKKKIKQHTLSKFTSPQYGIKVQMVTQEPEHDKLPLRNKGTSTSDWIILMVLKSSRLNNVACFKLISSWTIKRHRRKKNWQCTTS